MKKILVAALVAFGLMASTASATSIKEKHVGYTNMDIAGSTVNVFNFGYNVMFPVFTGTVNGLSLGFETNVNLGAIDSDTSYGEDSDSSSFVYGFNGGLLLGYTYGDIGIKTGVAGDYLNVGTSAYLMGLLYSVSTEYHFTKKFGVELSYKTGTMHLNSFSDKPDFNRDQFGLNLTWTFK